MILQKPLAISVKKTNSELEYETLRRDGIRFLQELCGKAWTDFNPHDPGVTIWEQVAFALSELGYKTGFDIKDYLTGADARIAYPEQGMFPPESVFPGAPVTPADFAKLFFANIPGLENVSVSRVSGDGYTVRIVPAATEENAARRAFLESDLRKRVNALWMRWRNLGDVIDNFVFDWKEKCYLDGCVELTGTRPAADVLLDIYTQCAGSFGSKIEAERYDGQFAKGLAPEDLFDGPLCPAGFLNAADFETAGAPVCISGLENEIRKVSGVLRVNSLAVVTSNGKDVKDKIRSGLQLCIGAGLPVVRLFQGGRELPLLNSRMLERIQTRILKRRRADRVSRSPAELRQSLPPLPAGTRRDVLNFSPIADQFPALYRAEEELRQLQGFLAPLEFLFKDFLRKIEDFPALYSIQERSRALERYNLVLNQMLAVYGFRFPDALFLTLRNLPAESVPLELIQAKRTYLRRLPELAKLRSGEKWLHRLELMIGVDLDSLAPEKKPVFVDGAYLDGAAGCIFIVWPVISPFMQQESNRIAFEEFIRDELPAHLVPYIYWAGEGTMHFFRLIYSRWLASLIGHKNYSEPLLTWFGDNTALLSGGFWL